jgi:hypothetical protein
MQSKSIGYAASFRVANFNFKISYKSAVLITHLLVRFFNLHTLFSVDFAGTCDTLSNMAWRPALWRYKPGQMLAD